MEEFLAPHNIILVILGSFLAFFMLRLDARFDEIDARFDKVDTELKEVQK